MAAASTALAAQLQAIQSHVQVDDSGVPSSTRRRPITRPSVLFSPKEAADVDVDTIYNIAAAGLDALESSDGRFERFRKDLFSHKTKELDRELLTPDENKRINASITSYLRLLSGYFRLSSALKTIEYLIRRYKIHVYNMEELILCALPYHESHVFVRIVQLLNFRNTKWKFLEGVKASGAPPTRQVIVQQCIRDLGVLETLCNYASPSKKSQASSVVLSFCTAVVIESLQSLATVEDEIVKRILPFVHLGLQLGLDKGFEHQASALMIACMLARKTSLSADLTNSLIRCIAGLAHKTADTTELQWVHLSFVGMINIVQSQDVDQFPEKAVRTLNRIRDVASILLEISKVFDIDKFYASFMGSLIDLSSTDASCRPTLVSLIETVPIGNALDRLIFKILLHCIKSPCKVGDAGIQESGAWVKNILFVIMKKYPSGLDLAVKKFLQESKFSPAHMEILSGTLSKAFDNSVPTSQLALDSKVWFSLHHPRAEVRRAALAELSASGILKADNVEGIGTIQDAVLRQFYDDDLSVVQEALSIKELPNIIDLQAFLQGLSAIVQRCVKILAGSSTNIAIAGNCLVLCLKYAIPNVNSSVDLSKEWASFLFPLLLTTTKTKKYNFKVLKLAKELDWPLYKSLPSPLNLEPTVKHDTFGSINLKISESLAHIFSAHPQEYVQWLHMSSMVSPSSKTMFLLVLLQSFANVKQDSSLLFNLLEICFPVLKSEWEDLVTSQHVNALEVPKILEMNMKDLMDHFWSSDLKELNETLLVYTFWSVSLVMIIANRGKTNTSDSAKWMGKLRELFKFFAGSNKDNVFKEHLYYLVSNCEVSPAVFLRDFITEEGLPSAVGIESLRCFSFLCSQSKDALSLELLAEFPAVLVSLSHENQGVRTAAMECLEGLHSLCAKADIPRKKNGSVIVWVSFLDELLDLMVQHKRLIVSDLKFLASLLSTILRPLGIANNLLVPQNIENRLSDSAKKEILKFIVCSAMKFSPYGKLSVLSLLKGVGGSLANIKEVGLLLSELMKRRRAYYFELHKSCQQLSIIEVHILSLLLEICLIEGSCKDSLLDALQLNDSLTNDPAVMLPCITVLNKLSSQIFVSLACDQQEMLFHKLVVLFRQPSADIQNLAKEALLRLEVTSSMLISILHFWSGFEFSTPCPKKKAKLNTSSDMICDIKRGDMTFLSSMLDVLLMKNNITNREDMVGPLFKIVGCIFSDEWTRVALALEVGQVPVSSGTDYNTASTLVYIQQTIFLLLENIISSSPKNHKDEISNNIDIKLLVKCAGSTSDRVTRNHILSLLSTIAEFMPAKLLDHIEEVLTIAGKSSAKQMDSQSLQVFEGLLSSIIPCWLLKSDSERLLQVFVTMLPEIAEDRRVSIFMFLIRSLGGPESLASLAFLLFQSLVARKALSEPDIVFASAEAIVLLKTEWEYVFSLRISERYPCITWLSSLSLQSPELSLSLKSKDNYSAVQEKLQQLLEQVVHILHLLDEGNHEAVIPHFVKRDIKNHLNSVLRTVTVALAPSPFFKCMVELLGSPEENVRRKALGLLITTMKDQNQVQARQKGRKRVDHDSVNLLQLKEGALEAFNQMCIRIVGLVNSSLDDGNTSIKLTAISALKVVASKYSSDYTIFDDCLKCVIDSITSQNMVISATCLRTTATFVNVLGPRALVHLPLLMNSILRTSSVNGIEDVNALSSSRSVAWSDHLLSIFIALESVVDKLGGFLNPYIESIFNLLILHPEVAPGSDSKLRSKVEAVRKLICQKIPVRLALQPLMKLFSHAVNAGDASFMVTFQMLGSIIVTMDRSSVAGYHAKVYDLCLTALDIRRQHPASVKNIGVAESNVINAMILLTMKLTETMFKPLFIRTVEWAESEVERNGSERNKNTDRAISFYRLVDKLVENHRSLFVPYFKYLLNSTIRHLTDAHETLPSDLVRKKKKAKVSRTDDKVEESNSEESVGRWHLRALILSALQKCFLYDTGSLKFLDSTNFQVLLKPLVAQLVIEPPRSINDCAGMPSVEEADDVLVNCIGQMAVTAGSDLLWKSLNHEVLMQTRSEKVRTRILGLRIVKILVERLKEEYLIFLPETIPFLGELLEDVELPVKSLAQDILREMESLSGESLRQYL
ncbi:hypothetical protein MLD38_002826 [Melastoma candidum]|uniref:Uncharacterized protein n=1 Tax=Melastoma candidum TaxID=119954 RepID=A0ACB9S514_9MYRT|nr:hypothetical protein MLD38_002826 [Melastoma candidum]